MLPLRFSKTLQSWAPARAGKTALSATAAARKTTTLPPFLVDRKTDVGLIMVKKPPLSSKD
jgi:hypothetical protein